MFICPECKCLLQSSNDYIMHIKYVHQSLYDYKCGAPLCSNKYTSFESFRKHMRVKHGMGTIATNPLSSTTNDFSFNNTPSVSNFFTDSDDMSSISNNPLPSHNVVDTNTTFLSENYSTLPVNDNNMPNVSANALLANNSSILEHGAAFPENDDTASMIDNNDLSNDNITVFDVISDKDSDSNNDDLDQNDFSEFEQAYDIPDHILFAAKMYSYYDVSRFRAQCIINDTRKLLQNVINNIKNEVLQCLESSDNKADITNKIKTIFEEKTSQLSGTQTEWQCMKTFTSIKSFIPPQEYVLGEREDYRRRNNGIILKMVRVTAQFIPMHQVLKAFFELPGILNETFQYLDYLKNKKDFISNFIQGSLWKSISTKFAGKTVFPLFLFFDDYETNNPLGSHKGVSKCGAIYLSIPCLPPELVSKLENIFLFVLFNSLDRTLYKNKIIFSKIVDELMYLENMGIKVNYLNQELTIYFKLALVLGDNLGIHSVFGLTESFNSLLFCCFCRINKYEIATAVNESQCSIRTVENYNTDVVSNDVKTTGVIENCIFHSLPDFHITKNLSIDVMHDILEGVCQYDLGLIFHQFIKIDKFFSLEDANNLIKGFNYGTSKNKPPQILDTHIKKKRLIMSASEMLCFVRYISLIFGPLVTPENKVWDFYHQLRAIVEISVSPEVHASMPAQLVIKISDYLHSLNILFPDNMKPKHHFLLHYPRVLLTSGPLAKMSSIRFESKHREGKITSRVSISRVNICRTIALKHQLSLNYRLLNKGLTAKVKYNIDQIEILKFLDWPEAKFFEKLLPVEIQLSKRVSIVKKIIFKNSVFHEADVLMIPTMDDMSFYIVHKIIIYGPENVDLVVQKLKDVYLNEHIQSYRLASTQHDWTILKLNDLNCSHVSHIVKLCNGINYIVRKWE